MLATLQDNYVRPDEANAAQSKVATRGKHRFIDKVHVRYVEREKRHWAALENFNSQRIAIAEKFYRDNERLLEGGIWAEVTIGYNEIDEDDYTFYVEDLRPIQLSRFDFEGYAEGRRQFTRDEWLDVVLRSVGLEPAKLSRRLKFHFVAAPGAAGRAELQLHRAGAARYGQVVLLQRVLALLHAGQRRAGVEGILFYNNARKRVGLVGFWDTVAFDEVGGIKIKDPDTMQIMKDFMANGRFSRGVEVIADASLAFVGNIDHSIEQLVNSTEHDLFLPLPKEFDLAIMDRFACYLPGWEMLKNSSEYLTGNYGLITDYLAEAFHHQFTHTNRYEEVNRRIRLGAAVEGRDEKGIKKTVCAFLKILHPDGPPSDAEFEEYVAYAVECRRRVKEQMNKRKPDDEFALIDLSYFTAQGEEVVVYCPESKDALATQQPTRRTLANDARLQRPPHPPRSKRPLPPPVLADQPPEAAPPEPARRLSPVSDCRTAGTALHDLLRRHGPQLRVHLRDRISAGAREVVIEEPYIRLPHQIQNFVRFCEAVVKHGAVKRIHLITGYDETTPMAEIQDKLGELKQSLLELDVVLDIELNPNLHDREIRLDNGWVIKIGRGLDFYQKPGSWFEIGVNDLALRKCLETKVDIFRVGDADRDAQDGG